MDITNPVSAGPLPMWEICADKTVCEITDDDMGYTYGNPVITKRASDDKWVVIVTSGMNNTSPGTGRGYLYVLDALTGKVLDKVEAIDGTTTWGDTTTPSGLSKISAFANSFNTDNTATFVYGGDLFGNVWRFDMSVSPPKVLKLAELKDAGGKPQSITSRPELGIISGNRVIFIGTGRYLGQSDLSDPATLLPALGWAYQQSFYAFKDKDSGYAGDIRKSTPGLVKQTISETAGVRTTSTTPVKWDSTNDGWYVDFNPGTAPGLSPGERVNLDPQLILGTLVVVTNVPNKDACSTGGDSFLYQFDYRSGSYISTSANNAVAQKFSGKITVGVVIVRLPKGIFKGIVTGASGQKTSTGVNLGSGGGTGRRVSWRELIP
jgi:type IV pilus assembly protein PilY1